MSNTNNSNEHHSHQNESLPKQEMFHCQSCNLTLKRSHFQKKELAKLSQRSSTSSQPPLLLTCHSCKKRNTALRCHQPPPKIINTGRLSESGVRRRPNNFGYCTYIDRLFSLSCFPDIVNLGSDNCGGGGSVFHSAKDVSESMGSIHAAARFGIGGVNGRDSNRRSRRRTNNHNQEKEDEEEEPNAAKGRDKDENEKGIVLCLCIGDGNTPRTAILASFMNRGWRTVSIDPNLNHEWVGDHGEKVRGMIGYRGTMEEFMAEPDVEKHIPRMPASSSSSTYSDTTSTNTHKNDNDVTNDDGSGEMKTTNSSSSPPTTVIRHLILLCVHSHVQFRKTTRIDSIRLRYGSPPTTLVSIPCCHGFRHVGDVGREPDVKYDDDCVFSACRTVSVWNFIGAVGGGDEGEGSGGRLVRGRKRDGDDGEVGRNESEKNGLAREEEDDVILSPLSKMKFCQIVK